MFIAITLAIKRLEARTWEQEGLCPKNEGENRYLPPRKIWCANRKVWKSSYHL